MMKNGIRLLAFVVVLATSGVAFAGDPCTTDWECPGWTGCFFGECDTEEPGVMICDSSGEEGTGCPEGCECINDGCVCEGASLVGCSTGADCAESEDCVKGGCVEHDDGGGKSASCDALDDCPQGQACVRHRCVEKAAWWCKADDECQDVESCALDCMLYEYGPGGSFDDAICIFERGKCELDLSKVELKPECEPFCEKLGPCWEDAEDGEKGSGKADTITDGSDMVLECKYMCSILLSEPAHQPSMDAAIACLADVEGTCADYESGCDSELAAAFGGQSGGAGGPDANESVEDVLSDDSAPTGTNTGIGGGGSCTTAPSAAASASGLLLLLLAALFLVAHSTRHFGGRAGNRGTAMRASANAVRTLWTMGVLISSMAALVSLLSCNPGTGTQGQAEQFTVAEVEWTLEFRNDIFEGVGPTYELKHRILDISFPEDDFGYGMYVTYLSECSVELTETQYAEVLAHVGPLATLALKPEYEVEVSDGTEVRLFLRITSEEGKTVEIDTKWTQDFVAEAGGPEELEAVDEFLPGFLYEAAQAQACKPCAPNCADRVCGFDDCLGTCGECADGDICVLGQCLGDAADGSVAVQVNAFTEGNQLAPSVALLGGDDFIVAWQSCPRLEPAHPTEAVTTPQDGSYCGVYARKYSGGDTDNPAPVFEVNVTTPEDQRAPVVAGAPDDSLLIAWESCPVTGSLGQDGDECGVIARFYSADGASTSDEIVVNEFTQWDQWHAAIARLTDGRFIVVWEGGRVGDGPIGIGGRIISATGEAASPEFAVSSAELGGQELPSIAALSDGGFFVAWQTCAGAIYDTMVGPDGDGCAIVAQRFDGELDPVGGESVVNTYAEGDQVRPSVISLEGCGALVTWASWGQDGDGWGIFGQRFDANGMLDGGEFQVNTYFPGDQEVPTTLGLPTGSSVVFWEGLFVDSNNSFTAQLYSAQGVPQGTNFALGNDVGISQRDGAFAAFPNGDVLIAFWSGASDGDGAGVFVRRLASVWK